MSPEVAKIIDNAEIRVDYGAEDLFLFVEDKFHLSQDEAEIVQRTIEEAVKRKDDVYIFAIQFVSAGILLYPETVSEGEIMNVLMRPADYLRYFDDPEKARKIVNFLSEAEGEGDIEGVESAEADTSKAFERLAMEFAKRIQDAAKAIDEEINARLTDIAEEFKEKIERLENKNLTVSGRVGELEQYIAEIKKTVQEEREKNKRETARPGLGIFDFFILLAFVLAGLIGGVYYSINMPQTTAGIVFTFLPVVLVAAAGIMLYKRKAKAEAIPLFILVFLPPALVFAAAAGVILLSMRNPNVLPPAATIAVFATAVLLVFYRYGKAR